MRNLCLKLKQIRQESDLTQEELADLLGLTRQAYSHKENGKRKFTLEEALIIADTFGLKVEEIFLTNYATNCS